MKNSLVQKDPKAGENAALLFLVSCRWRCQECGALVSKGRRSCQKCHSEDLEVAE